MLFPAEIAEIATDLQTAGGDCTPEKLAEYVVQELKNLAETCIRDKKSWMDDYRKYCITTGRPVQVVSPLDTRDALALSVADDGGLLVEYPDGSQSTVSSGEVSVRGMYAYT